MTTGQWFSLSIVMGIAIPILVSFLIIVFKLRKIKGFGNLCRSIFYYHLISINSIIYNLFLHWVYGCIYILSTLLAITIILSIVTGALGIW